MCDVTFYGNFLQADINLAVAAAKRAFHRNSEWRLLDAAQRGAILYKFADLVERDAEYLSELESYNNGAVASFAKIFTQSGIQSIRYLASLADKIQGDTIPLSEYLSLNVVFTHYLSFYIKHQELTAPSKLYSMIIKKK